jgi:hypothetical protein
MPLPSDAVTRFDASQLRTFLGSVDAHLSAPAEITVIGGSAVALYGVSSGTMDIDTYESRLASHLQRAVDQARLTTGLNIPVVPAPVAQVPYNFEDRVQRESADWKNLTVYKLEPHDLALSKAARGSEGDLAALDALHRVLPLDPEVLVSRYLAEMGHSVGDPARLDTCFLLLIERLFGEAMATHLEKRIQEARTARRV